MGLQNTTAIGCTPETISLPLHDVCSITPSQQLEPPSESPEVENEEEWEMDDEDHTEVQVDDEAEEETTFNSKPRVYIFAPTKEDAFAAFTDITNILKPPRKTGRGY